MSKLSAAKAELDAAFGDTNQGEPVVTSRNGTRNGRTTPRKVKPVEIPAVTIEPPAGKLRLLKVTLQPTFVLVADNGSVQEITHPVVEVKGVDWPTWAPDVFSEDALEHLRQTITPVQQP